VTSRVDQIVYFYETSPGYRENKCLVRPNSDNHLDWSLNKWLTSYSMVCPTCQSLSLIYIYIYIPSSSWLNISIL